MNLPFVWIILPILFAITALFVRNRNSLYYGLLLALSLILCSMAFIIASQNNEAGLPFTLYEDFSVLGRRFVITSNDLSLVGVIYALIFFWILAAFFQQTNSYFPALSVIYAALSIASYSIEPFLYSVLIIFLANTLYLPVLSSGSFQKISGRMRFLVFQLLSVFLILLAGWILAGGEITPVDEDQLFFSSILLGLGIATWLGTFPFHTWIPLLAEEVLFMPFGFMLTLFPISGILMLMKFLNDFAWLREFQAFFISIQYLGAAMVLIGGIGSFFQKLTSRVFAFVFINGIGMLLCGVGFIPSASTDLVAGWMVPFILSLLSISLANQKFTGSNLTHTIEDLKGKITEYPLFSLLLLSGLSSLIGLPLSSGFAPNLELLYNAQNTNQIILVMIICGQVFLILTGIRLLLRLVLASPKRFSIPGKIGMDSILILFLILFNTILGLFPKLVNEPVLATIGRIFPLL